MTAEKPNRRASNVPAHEQVYQRLREQVLFGEMAPGQAVTIQGLTESLGVGMTPVREAIRRLISDGALMFQGNRRVSVPVLSNDDLKQLLFIRKSVEPELTRLAAMRMNSGVVARLEKVDERLDAAIEQGDVPGYLARNFEFHRLINDQADAPILAELADRMWLRFGPSLRVVCGRFGTQNLPDRHKELLEALRDGDADAAAVAMQHDVEQGMDLMTSVLTGQADSIDT